MKLFNELKRRNVFRAAGLYGVVGWALAQVASLLENALTLPGWFDALVISLLLLGFPIAIIFAWAYEMTPEGLKPTKDVAADASIAAATGRKLDMAILAGIGVLIAVIVADRFLDRKDARVIAVGERGSHAALADNSIAVLPFTDMSPEQDQGYFSDGISEELLNVLAQVKDLRVAGRTSSFSFKGQNKDLREIGDILDVGYIVEGSIRKAGNKVRVTAQLIQAKDGYHQWSNTYDRDLNDIFAVQDEIAEAIVAEMSAALPALAAAKETLKPSPRAADISAYDMFLLAREKMTQVGTKAAYEEAVRLLEDSIAKDPHYAPALAWRSYAESMLSESPGGVGDRPFADALPVSRKYAERALAEDPNSAEGLFALGSYYGQLIYAEGLDNLDRTIATLKKAIAVRPNFPQAENDLAFFLNLKGEEAEGMRIIADVLTRDPGLRDANAIYVAEMQDRGRFDEAEAAIERFASVSPDNPAVGNMRVGVLLQRGRLAEAWRMSEALIKAGHDPADLATYRYFIRSNLGDGDWILANTKGRRQAFGAALAGDYQRAAAIVDADPAARGNTAAALSSYIPVHYAAGDVAAVVAYYDTSIGSPQAMVDAVRACNCAPIGLLQALKDAGHKDYEPALSAWKAFIASKREEYAKSPLYLTRAADAAALSGDFAEAKKLYTAAIDAGARNAALIDRRIRKFLPRNAEFDAILVRMRTLIDAERKALGLPPLKSPS